MSIYDDIDAATTPAQLAKVLDLQKLKAAAKQYVWGKEYRKARQTEILRLAQLARDAGLDK